MLPRYPPGFFFSGLRSDSGGGSRRSLDSSALPSPKIRDQKPRFNFGCGACGAIGGSAPAVPVTAAAAAAAMDGGAAKAGSSACAGAGGALIPRTSAILVVMLRAGCRSQYVVGSLPRAKYSV